MTPPRPLPGLLAHDGLARLGVVTDLTAVLTQALVAIGFLAPFRSTHAVAAAAVTAFGLVNAVLMLVAVAATTTALGFVDEVGGARTALLLYELGGAAGRWAACSSASGCCRWAGWRGAPRLWS